MAVNVNPPPGLRIPKAFLNDPETREYISQLNTIIFQLYRRSGGVNDVISEIGNEGVTSFPATLQQAIKRLDGLPEFTVDTTGFTTDLTTITTDKVIA